MWNKGRISVKVSRPRYEIAELRDVSEHLNLDNIRTLQTGIQQDWTDIMREKKPVWRAPTHPARAQQRTPAVTLGK